MYIAFDSKPNFVENMDYERKQAFVYTAWIVCKSNVWPLQINKQVDLVCTPNHFKMFILYFTAVLVLFSGSIIHSFIYLLLTQRHHKNDLLKNMPFFCFCETIESRSHYQLVTVTDASITYEVVIFSI